MNETPIVENMYTNFQICADYIQDMVDSGEEISELDAKILEVSNRLLSIRGSDPLV